MLAAGGWLLVVGCLIVVAGCWVFVACCWLLIVGCWLLVIDCWSLVVGFSEKVSMLVVDFQANFSKKAKSKIYFTCEDGAKVVSAVEEAIATGEGQTIQMLSIGKNKAGDEVARVVITWSFKRKD